MPFGLYLIGRPTINYNLYKNKLFFLELMVPLKICG